MKVTQLHSLATANRLVSKLAPLIDGQLRRQHDFERSVKNLQRLVKQPIPTIEQSADDDEETRECKSAVRDMLSGLERGWEKITGYGANIRNAEIGEIELYGMMDGKLVWFQWRSGEKQILRFRDLAGGFPMQHKVKNNAVNSALN